MKKQPPSQSLDKTSFNAEYTKLRPLYERLAINLQQALRTFLSENNIPHLDITYRIKDFESAFEKIERKGYQQPLDQIEDWCGLRVICYYPSDVRRVCEIIENEFDVREEEDKAQRLEAHEFGYRSTHFIVKTNSSWLKAPNYRGLGHLKAEIQVRTILMHAWAEIEHKLAYKSADQVPDKFRRNLYRLSAKFEEADEQFDDLRAGLSEYRAQVRSIAQSAGEFDKDLELNLDTLQAFLDFHFPDRKKSIKHTGELLEEMQTIGLSMRDALNAYQQLKDHIPTMEADYLGPTNRWFQVGVLRSILGTENEKYHKSRLSRTDSLNEGFNDFIRKWRKQLIINAKQ